MINITRLTLFRPFKYAPKINNTRSFFTSPKSQAIPPIVWLFVKPITKLSSIIFGRSFRKWWTALPSNKKEIFRNHLSRNKHRYGLITTSTCAGSFIFYQSRLKENLITGRKQLILFNQVQMQEFSKFAFDLALEDQKDNIVNESEKECKRVTKIIKRLIDANDWHITVPSVSNIEWKVNVINSEMVNASAFPDGSIIVYSGLLKHCKTDDELAFVLGHEMSHAILDHSVEKMSLGRLVDILMIGSIFLVWLFVPSDLIAILGMKIADMFFDIYIQLPFSRQMETEADKLGLVISARACYDVRESVTFFREKGENTDKVEIDESLSTHPSNEQRSKELLKLMPAALKLRDDCNCYKLEEFSRAVNLLKKT